MRGCRVRYEAIISWVTNWAAGRLELDQCLLYRFCQTVEVKHVPLPCQSVDVAIPSIPPTLPLPVEPLPVRTVVKLAAIFGILVSCCEWKVLMNIHYSTLLFSTMCSGSLQTICTPWHCKNRVWPLSISFLVCLEQWCWCWRPFHFPDWESPKRINLLSPSSSLSPSGELILATAMLFRILFPKCYQQPFHW